MLDELIDKTVAWEGWAMVPEFRERLRTFAADIPLPQTTTIEGQVSDG